MSAPNTNVEKQARRHRPALIGITAAIVFAAVLFVVWLFFILTPESADLETTVNDEPVDQAAAVDPQASDADEDAQLTTD